MNFELKNSNLALSCQQVPTMPLFNRLTWFSLFEKFICNDSFSAQTFSLVGKDKQIYFPLAKSGKQLKSLTNYYSPFYRLISNQMLEQADYQQIIFSAQDELKKYDTVDLLPLYENDAQYFKRAFENIGFKGFIYQHSTNWYHDNITDLDQYWSLRPSKLRNTLKRKKIKMEESGEYSVVMSSPNSTSSLNRYLADYHHVYYDSWKKVEPIPAFIDAIAHYAWQQGELRLGLIYHKEIPVAAQIWFVNAKVAYIYKLAYRRNYTKTSVGTVLTAAMMEHVIDQDKVSSVDFLTGDDSYKQDWMESKRSLMGLQLCNPGTWQGKKNISINLLSGIREWSGL